MRKSFGLQHWLFCSAEVIWTKSCSAANEKLHCNIKKAVLQESGAFLQRFPAGFKPTFRHPRFGPSFLWRTWALHLGFPWFSVFPWFPSFQLRKAPDTFNFLRHVMRAIWSVRQKCSHRCISGPADDFRPPRNRAPWGLEQKSSGASWGSLHGGATVQVLR